MNKDIVNSADINLLINTFYTQVIQDEILAPVFIKQNFDLASHLPVMVSFWEGILLNVHTYKGNPIKIHQQMNATSPLLSIHFERWLSIWSATVDSLFAGPKAEEAVKRAKTIAMIMMAKL
ncbi:MAG: group III truncated hemoglobin [Pedobacter sp.]|nr:MAG: group III truncated hemoglobin [Pedobacter sp.]